MQPLLSQVQIGRTFGSRFGVNLGPADLVSILLSNALVAAAILLFILILAGGFMMIVGAGSENPETTARGKKAATGAIIGFIIIFAAYWIIKIVESLTGLAILNPGL